MNVKFIIRHTKKIPVGNHRHYVGGLWEMIGKLQFDFMRYQNLKPEHVLFDIACGSLRGGSRFIEYLDSGNYVGIDSNLDLVNIGFNKEVKSKDKNSVFLICEDFAFDALDIQPDFAIAQSLFTHLTRDDIKLCLRNLNNYVANGAFKFYATFFIGNILEHPKSHPHRAFYYPLDVIDDLASQTGWKLSYIGEWGHPRNQKMVLFYR